MKNNIKRILAVLLAAMLTMLCLGGCIDGPEYSFEEYGNGATAPAPQFASRPTLPQWPFDDETEDTQPAQATQPVQTTEPAPTGQLVAKNGEQIRYVLVYNPKIYTDDYNAGALNTGNIAAQVDVDMNRGEDLTGEPEIIPYEQAPLSQEFLDRVDLEGNKADGLGKIYKVGDQEVFYCGSAQDLNQRVQQNFTCVYAGSHANIWVYENLDQNVLNKLGNSFDSKIYDACVSRFGEARFGEVVNILIYDFGQARSTVGFFYYYDLFTTNECTAADITQLGMNLNMNVININAAWLGNEQTATSTLAHEFQHLLCFTGYFTMGNLCDTWFNEAMSGYIEEALYYGSKQDSVDCYHDSQRVRYGQSLYNFTTDTSSWSFDIGPYGSVYLFSEFLKNVAGESVFSSFHSNWRNTYTEMNTFEGIYEAVPDSLRQEVDSRYTYPSSLRFNSEAEEWVSKLTLSFYLSTFTKDKNTPANYRDIDMSYLAYDSMQEAKIEGGGRVIIAVKNGSFTIPQDADSGLLFVGLNEDLQIVTDLICK